MCIIPPMLSTDSHIHCTARCRFRRLPSKIQQRRWYIPIQVMARYSIIRYLALSWWRTMVCSHIIPFHSYQIKAYPPPKTSIHPASCISETQIKSNQHKCLPSLPFFPHPPYPIDRIYLSRPRPNQPRNPLQQILCLTPTRRLSINPDRILRP